MGKNVERAHRPSIIIDALRGAAATFAISLILFVSMVGLKTDNVAQGLTVTTHFTKAFLLAALVTVIRFLLDILVWRQSAKASAIMRERAYAIGRMGAVIAFALGAFFFLFSGFRTSIVDWGASIFWLLGTAIDLVTFGAMAAFVLFFAMGVVRVIRWGLNQTAAINADGGRNLRQRLTKNIGQEFPAALMIVAALLPVVVVGSSQRYAIDTATQILIYIMLGWGLNVVVGLAGLLDLGYVAFYAVGAYTYALLSTKLDWSFWICLPLAGFLAALWGITLGFPVLRLRGDYLAIVTLAFGEIVRIVLQNWQSFTGGPNGIQLPKLTFFGLPFSRGEETNFFSFFGLDYDPAYRIIFLYYVILVLALFTNFVTLRLRRLPIGRAWEALREDEIACRSLGINTVTTKLSAFAIGAMFAGFAGAFFAARLGFITPESFTFQESALVLAIVVLGGLGSQIGVVIAAVALVGSAERFRELQDYRMLIFGLSMVLIMTWRPRGLMASRTPSAVLHKAQSISSAFVTEGRG